MNASTQGPCPLGTQKVAVEANVNLKQVNCLCSVISTKTLMDEYCINDMLSNL